MALFRNFLQSPLRFASWYQKFFLQKYPSYLNFQVEPGKGNLNLLLTTRKKVLSPFVIVEMVLTTIYAGVILPWILYRKYVLPSDDEVYQHFGLLQIVMVTATSVAKIPILMVDLAQYLHGSEAATGLNALLRMVDTFKAEKAQSLRGGGQDKIWIQHERRCLKYSMISCTLVSALFCVPAFGLCATYMGVDGVGYVIDDFTRDMGIRSEKLEWTLIFGRWVLMTFVTFSVAGRTFILPVMIDTIRLYCYDTCLTVLRMRLPLPAKLRFYSSIYLCHEHITPFSHEFYAVLSGFAQAFSVIFLWLSIWTIGELPIFTWLVVTAAGVECGVVCVLYLKLSCKAHESSGMLLKSSKGKILNGYQRRRLKSMRVLEVWSGPFFKITSGGTLKDLNSILNNLVTLNIITT